MIRIKAHTNAPPQDAAYAATGGVLALGASFSALEVVPLALYYMQGLNTTPPHGHTALFGVYGMLGIGLMPVYAAVTHGFWYARSAEFLQQPLMQTLVWLRMPGDVVCSIGAGTGSGRLRAPAAFLPSRWHASQSGSRHMLNAAPHRIAFFCGLASLLAASLWWALHLLARHTGVPLFALDLAVAPIWAHSFLMLFTVFPTFFLGFLFTTYPRWMNGPLVPRSAYVTAPLLLTAATVCWLVGTHSGPNLQLAAAVLAAAGLATALVALLRVLLDAEQVVSHAVVTSAAFAIGIVCAVGFGYGLWTRSDFVLHFAVRAALWGFLLPVFFAVCHRMVPFFSQGVVIGYVPWRPTWLLVAVVGLAWLRLLLGTAGALDWLVAVDAALFLLTALAAVRWTSLRARGNALLWTLYAGYAWLPVALLLQTARDASFVVTGEWALGRAPIHALGMGFFAGLLIAMVTRVTMGHSGRPLAMDRVALACFVGIQLAALARVASEIVTTPSAIQWLLLGSVALWLVAFATWGSRHARIYLAPRIDGRSG